MSLNRKEALVEARKLVRLLASAPDPRARANQVFLLLSHAQGWTAAQEARIASFGVWLNDRPPLPELRPAAAGLLSKLL